MLKLVESWHCRLEEIKWFQSESSFRNSSFRSTWLFWNAVNSSPSSQKKLEAASFRHQQVSFIPVLFTFPHSITRNSIGDFPPAHALEPVVGTGNGFYRFLWHTFSSLFSQFSENFSPSKRCTRVFRRWKFFICEILWSKVAESQWTAVRSDAKRLAKVIVDKLALPKLAEMDFSRNFLRTLIIILRHES